MRYFVGYKVYGEVEEYYSEITAAIERKFSVTSLARKIPPHITLQPPFEVDTIDIVRAELAELAASSVSLPLPIRGFGSFGTRTLYLKVVADEELQQQGDSLASELARIVPGKEVSLPITMHVSIARRLAPQQFQEVHSYLRSLPEPSFAAEADNLTLFRYINDAWMVEEMFEFKRK